MGRAAFTVSRADRATTLANLARAYPEIDDEQRVRMACDCFRSVGSSILDMVSLLGTSVPQLLGNIDCSGRRHLERLDDRGVVLLGAHLGTWEVALYAAAMIRGPVHVVSNVMRRPGIDRALREVRSRFDVETITRSGAARAMYRVLKKGGSVAVAMDQRIRPEEAVDVTFFGVPSLASPIPAFVSMKTGAPVVPVFCRKVAGRYEVRILPSIEPGGSSLMAIAASTQRFVDIIETQIREWPDLWLWMYRRWKAWDMSVGKRSSLAVETRSD